MRFLSPNGSPIVGTLERLTGRANATEYSETGEPEYDGYTEIWWDEQKTVTKGDSLVYVDEDGYQWVFSDLVPDDEDSDEDNDEAEAKAIAPPRPIRHYADDDERQD